ncbi:unnamed protein product [Orchesella dallaii]|uniref:TRAM domain-containing protein n=1 Tax=Orchesella dallaii TaxID=48710 RepID=A0ABP1R3K1_9HEXA
MVVSNQSTLSNRDEIGKRIKVAIKELSNRDEIGKRIEVVIKELSNRDEIGKRIEVVIKELSNRDEIGKRIEVVIKELSNRDEIGKRIEVVINELPNRDEIGRNLSTPAGSEDTTRTTPSRLPFPPFYDIVRNDDAYEEPMQEDGVEGHGERQLNPDDRAVDLPLLIPDVPDGNNGG